MCDIYEDSMDVAKSGGFMMILIGSGIYALCLWLSFWAATQIREAVFRQAFNKGESFDGAYQKAC